MQARGIIIGWLLRTSSTNNNPPSNSNSTQCLRSVVCHLEEEVFPFSSFVNLSKVMVCVSPKKVAVGSVGQAESLIEWVPLSEKHKLLYALTDLLQAVDKGSFRIFLITLPSAIFSMLSQR